MYKKVFCRGGGCYVIYAVIVEGRGVGYRSTLTSYVHVLCGRLAQRRRVT